MLRKSTLVELYGVNSGAQMHMNRITAKMMNPATESLFANILRKALFFMPFLRGPPPLSQGCVHLSV